MRLLLTLAALLFATPALADDRFWITLTNHPGEQAFGRIVNGYAVDIVERRGKAGVSNPLPKASTGGGNYSNSYSGPVASEAAVFLFALNAWRAQHGQGPLRWDAGLAAYAASNRGVHDPGSSGGGSQCWAGTSSLMAALPMWQRSGPHAAILLGATSVIGAARCPSGSTCNAR